MKSAFADTAFYIALVNPHDELHASALDLARNSRGRIVTTEYVLLEVGNRLARSGDKPVFVELVRRLRTDAGVAIVPAGPTLFQAGLDLLERRLDKNWSLTDCISFVVMRQAAISEALTADHHFEQAGFVALMK